MSLCASVLPPIVISINNNINNNNNNNNNNNDDDNPKTFTKRSQSTDRPKILAGVITVLAGNCVQFSCYAKG